MNHAIPGWPHKTPGFLGIWLDRMKSYVDAHAHIELPPRGVPIALRILPPATGVGDVTVTRNPDGSATLDGHMDVAGPLADGDPVPFALMPNGYGLASSAGLMAIATTTSGPGRFVVGIDINPDDGGTMFVVGPDVAQGQTLMVTLDGVTFWPAPASHREEQ